jgi:hypothetical protein
MIILVTGDESYGEQLSSVLGTHTQRTVYLVPDFLLALPILSKMITRAIVLEGRVQEARDAYLVQTAKKIDPRLRAIGLFSVHSVHDGGFDARLDRDSAHVHLPQVILKLLGKPKP